MNKYFYHTTESVLNQVTNVFDFAWPMAVAVWNLRWQVEGYNNVRGENIGQKELFNRFALGSGIHGANLKRFVSSITWEHQQEELAKFILTNIFAIYEGWKDNLTGSLGINSSKDMEFSSMSAQGNLMTVLNVFSKKMNSSDKTISSFFYDDLRKDKKYSLAAIDELMICYRFFKECRNCIIHNNSIADEKAVKAYHAFTTTSHKFSSVKISEIPESYPVTNIGDEVHLSLRGVVGFTDVIIRIITTIDVELARSKYSEMILIDRWQSRPFAKLQSRTDMSSKYSRMRYHLTALHLPVPNKTLLHELYLWLKAKKIMV